MLLPSLTRKILVCGASGLLMASLAACDKQSGADKQPAPASPAPQAPADTPAPAIDRTHKGGRLPDLTFLDANGKTISTGALTGQPLLINLWATWCGPCVAELPTLDQLAKDGRIRVLTLSQDTESSAPRVAPFLAAKGLAHLPAWLDPQGAAATQWQVTTLPTSIYYDAQGREVWRISGGMNWISADAAKLLTETGV